MPLFTEKIYFGNSRWFNDLLPKIDYFYRRAFFPEMLTRQVQRGRYSTYMVVGYHMDNTPVQEMV